MLNNSFEVLRQIRNFSNQVSSRTENQFLLYNQRKSTFILWWVFSILITRSVSQRNAASNRNWSGICLLKVNKRNARTGCEICSKLIINVNGNDLAILILGSNYIRSHRSKDIKQTSFHEKTSILNYLWRRCIWKICWQRPLKH